MVAMEVRPVDVNESPRVSPLLTREQLVEQILAHNPSAASVALERFDGNALAVYLQHLLAAQTPRGRAARWLRPGDTPAIVRAIPAED